MSFLVRLPEETYRSDALTRFTANPDFTLGNAQAMMWLAQLAYETDDLVAFGDLVRALRATESRRSTVSDTPILLGIHRPMDEILGLLGAG